MKSFWFTFQVPSAKLNLFFPFFPAKHFLEIFLNHRFPPPLPLFILISNPFVLLFHFNFSFKFQKLIFFVYHFVSSAHASFYSKYFFLKSFSYLTLARLLSISCFLFYWFYRLTNISSTLIKRAFCSVFYWTNSDLKFSFSLFRSIKFKINLT